MSLRIINATEDNPMLDWECTPATGTCPNCERPSPYSELCPEGVECDECWYDLESGRLVAEVAMSV